jgi:uncharacterized protein YndB with AHSA1/START domain
MPIKKDGTGKRWVELELLVPGTPEQVWQAMATGPGNAAWFTKGEIEERVGGSFLLDFGQGATSRGEVTEWSRPHRFCYVEYDWEPGAPPVATEITITGRSGSGCVVRMVHSLFTASDAWDDQIEGFENGWPGFFAVLKIYLEHFAASPAASFIASSPVSTNGLASWLRLGDLLGLGGANVGERRGWPSGPEGCSGIVEHVHQDAQQRYVLLRLDAPSPGVVLVGTYEKRAGTNVSLCRYYYGENAAELAAASEAFWREWLAEFPGRSGGR